MSNLLKIEKFKSKYFKDYQTWSSDPEFNKRLGPIDQEWLGFILRDETGDQYAFTHSGELMAVVGVLLPTLEDNYYTITDISVAPHLRSKGIGTKALNLLMRHYSRDTKTWKAFIEYNNLPAAQFFKKNGWETDGIVDSDGMLCLVFRN